MDEEQGESEEARGRRTEDLLPLDPRQIGVLRTMTFLIGLLPFVLVAIGDAVLAANTGFPFGVFTGLAVLIYALSVLILPGRRYRRWGYRLDTDMIRIASGLFFRFDTIVPFARVQHIDVARGPIERIFGVSTLILHTAGSYNSTVSLPGLAPEKAEEMRETIRLHIERDWS